MSTVIPPEHPDGRPGEDRGASAVADEQGETFQCEAAEGGRGKAPEEPSARARRAAAGRRRRSRPRGRGW
ncbi:hypothetical protein ACLQ2N_26240 [Streptomyces sp. DT224]|uniref:hypothetical protein n=1 Tax=Streptomyces sp. DT224 TaxID=3393426 RepID=UPI003CE8F3FE